MRDRLAEARNLLHLAADRFVPIPDDTVQTIIATERALAGGGLPAELEVRFWHAYRYLRANVIAATTLRNRYNLGFIALLLLVMAVQGLFISMSGLVTAMHNQRETVTAYLIGDSPECRPDGTGAAARSVPATPSASAGAAAAIGPDGCPTRRVSRTEYQLALSKLQGYDHVMQSYLTVLPGGVDPVDGATDYEALRQVREIDTAQHFADYGALVNATHFVEVFILPALYGALGASVFILRRFSDDLRSGSLAEDASLRFGLRVSIGVVAGLAIHWFIRSPDMAGGAGLEDTTMNALHNLSRYALSFVGGYGSEMVFNLLDRTVTAFSPGDTTAKPRAEAGPVEKPAANG
ncbi:hypothetical protein [Azospirillum halopraeferens]|uniref:hypothetical protein n=1 Tax=Azospirillum halopraeferens TaxID=34010 RepID=UPI000413DD74|nr:hypothetical protein [Azospirillum halopraeferens]